MCRATVGTANAAAHLALCVAAPPALSWWWQRERSVGWGRGDQLGGADRAVHGRQWPSMMDASQHCCSDINRAAQ